MIHDYIIIKQYCTILFVLKIVNLRHNTWSANAYSRSVYDGIVIRKVRVSSIAKKIEKMSSCGNSLVYNKKRSGLRFDTS